MLERLPAPAGFVKPGRTGRGGELETTPPPPPDDSWRQLALGRLADGIAHDFNTVLQVISAGAERIVAACPPTCQAEAEIILQATRRGSSLTRKVLQFGRTPLNRDQPIDLNLAIQENLEFAARLLGPEIRVVTELTRLPVIMVAERCHIERVLVNLLSNARDAMPDGGTVTIRTVYLTQGQNSIPAASSVSLPAVLLQIEDTGRGMNDEIQVRAFEPSFTTKPGLGTGLGLSIVADLVKQCGGWIGVSSAPGMGSRFDLVLPALPMSP
jgi:two-component system cell cycle sensor histidine kinase/response regulator CckA